MASVYQILSTPPGAPVAHGGEPPDNGAMEERVKKLEDGQQELKTQLVRIDTRLDHIETTMATKTDMADLRSDMHKMDASIKTWMIATVLAMMIGFGGLFMNVNKPTAPATQSQPIVIYAPSAAAAPQPAPAPAAKP